MEYVNGQLVGVRDRMTSAKAAEGESRTKVLQEVSVVVSCVCARSFPFTNNIRARCLQRRKRIRPHTPPPPARGTRDLKSSTTSGIQSWIPVVLPGGSIVPPSAMTPLSKARTWYSEAYVVFSVMFD